MWTEKGASPKRSKSQTRGGPIFRYHSLWLLIRVRTGQVRLTIPFPLFVLDQALAALADLAQLTDRLFPGLTRQWLRHGPGQPPPNFGLGPACQLCRALIHELRHYGRWRMVEVEVSENGLHHEESRVYIDFF